MSTKNISFLNAMIEQSPIAIQIMNPDGRIEKVNHAYKKLWGRSLKDLHEYNILKDEQAKKLGLMPFIKRGFAGETLSLPSFEYDPVKAKVVQKGRKRWIQSLMYSVKDENGKIMNVVMMHEDITERKNAEENIRRLAIVVKNSNDAITVQDFEGNITAWNQGAEWMYGWSEAEALKMNIRDIVPEDKREEALHLVKSIQEKKVKSFETKRVTKDGKLLDIWLTVTKLIDDSDKPIGIATTERDITERKKAEENIKHLIRILFAIRNVNQLIIKERDRDGLLKRICDILTEEKGYFNAWIALLDTSGKLVTAVEAGFGKDFLPVMELMKKGTITDCGQNALKQSDIIITKNPHAACENCPLSNKYTGRGVMTRRLECHGKIYGIMSVSISTVFLKDNQEINLFKEVTSDIAYALHGIETEEKRKRGQEQIKKDLKEKEILLRELYHRTKNNMQVICSILKLQASRMEDQRVNKLFKKIETTIYSMALVHQKLLKSKDLSHLNLKDYFDSLLVLFEQSYIEPNKDISFHTDMEDINVLIDTAVLLGLIFNELISNAIKHAFPDKKSGMIKVNLHMSPQNYIVLEVSDNGVGLPKSFDIRKDINLGLETAIDLIEYQLDGKIDFKSRNGLHCKIVIKEELYQPRV